MKKVTKMHATNTSTTTLTKQVSRRKLIQLAALSLALPAAHSANAEISLATAINRCARFRALSQRGAKAYLQLTLDVMPEAAQKTLATVLRLFQQGFSDIAQGSYTAEITKEIANIQTEVTKLIALITSPPKHEQLSHVTAQADKVLALAHKTTEALAQASASASKAASGKIIDMAGRQRMLSQRMAKNYYCNTPNRTRQG